MHRNANIDQIIKRVKQEATVTTNKQLADILGITGSSFSNMKRRGTILTPLIEWAISRKVNLSWLVYGEENKKPRTASAEKKEDGYTAKLAEWIAEEEEEEPRRRAEIELQIERALPEFREWLNVKKSEGSQREFIRSRDVETVA